MSQKMPKLPQLNPTVHGTGYLEENYGKKNFGFSEILPEMHISDTFVMYFRFLLRIFISDLFVKHLGWYFGFLYTVT